MGKVTLFLLLLNIFIYTELTTAGEYCDTSSNFWSTSIKYCSYGCCGSYGSYYCCPYANKIGIIIGSVIGGIILISIVVAVLCICMQKSKRRAGRVIQPANVGPTVIMAGQTNTNGQTHGYAYSNMPMQGYSNLPHPPPYPGPTSAQTTALSPGYISESAPPKY